MPDKKPKQPVLRLRLYVAGNAPNSTRAITSIRAICHEHFLGRHELEIVDMLDHPKRALADGIIVTPTLLKLSRRPNQMHQKLIGNLENLGQVLLALGAR